MTRQKNKSELRDAVIQLRPYFVRAAWFSLFSSLLILAPSGYMLEVYDRVVTTRNHMTLAMLTVLVLGAFALMEILEWARGEVLHEASHALDHHLSKRIFDVIFEGYLKRVSSPSIQPLHDFRTVKDFVASPVVTALMEVPVAIVSMLLIFLVSPVLGMAAVVGAILQTLVGWFNERSTQPPLVAANRSAIAAQAYADGSLRNAQVIESMGMLRDIHRKWMDRQSEFLSLQALASDRAGGFNTITKFLQTTMGSLLLGLACYLLLHNELNGGAGMMIVSSILGGRALAPLVQIVTQWRSVITVRDAWGRLDNLLSTLPARPPTMMLPAPRGAVQVENLYAGAPGNASYILKGVAFSLQPGDILAVVGPSASGKTTLARLLVGAWAAISGKVRLDGADVFTWNKEELGPNVGYLPQGVELFDGTLAENIARFGPPEPAKVQAAAAAVGLHDFIMSLPQGYDSPVGADGARLSGGQRQRVALARAIYGDPVYVVLDEPNSSLDDAGDAALASALKQLSERGTTFIVMTHRTSVLAVANKMLVLRDGTMQMFGMRDDVLAALKKASEQAAAQAAQQAQAAADAAAAASPAALFAAS